MRRIVNPGTELLVEREEKHDLPIGKPVAMYIRRSTMAQARGKNATEQSKYQQDDDTEFKLRKKGFTDIRKIVADDGVSGQRIDRVGKEELYAMIRAGDVGTVAFHN